MRLIAPSNPRNPPAPSHEQQPTDTPVFIRRASDKSFYTLSWAVSVGGSVFALYTAGKMALVG